jgi:hypothetical protein
MPKAARKNKFFRIFTESNEKLTQIVKIILVPSSGSFFWLYNSSL